MSETVSPSMKLNKTKAKPKVIKNEDTAPDAVAGSEPGQAQAVVEATFTKAKVSKAVDKELDLIIQVAHEIENLDDKKAFQLVPKLLNGIEQDYFKLGGVIALIQSNGWFMELGYENFKAYVQAEVGIEYRRAMYFIGIYNSLVTSGVKWSDVESLGWTKLKEIASILTPANVKEWVDLAEQMTTLQLQEYIKQQKAATTNTASGPATEEASKTTTMTFKLHEDQKATVREALEKCKSEMGTEVDSVALEHIALDFLGGDSKLKKIPTLGELMKQKSVDEVLEVLGAVFPTLDMQINVPDNA